MEFDETKPEPLVSPDTENATKFNPDESNPEQRAKYRRFERYNSGLYNGEWVDKQKIRRIDNLAVFDAISGQLELTTHQKRLGRELFDSLNLRRIGYRVELIAFTICMVVARDDGRMYHPKRAAKNNDSEFLALADSLGFEPGRIEACFNRVVEAVEK